MRTLLGSFSAITLTASIIGVVACQGNPPSSSSQVASVGTPGGSASATAPVKVEKAAGVVVQIRGADGKILFAKVVTGALMLDAVIEGDQVRFVPSVVAHDPTRPDDCQAGPPNCPLKLPGGMLTPEENDCQANPAHCPAGAKAE